MAAPSSLIGRIVSHYRRGALQICLLAAPARPQPARAHALEVQPVQGARAEAARAKARAAYQYFLNLWKDADPDITILKQAKAEYAKMK